MEQPHSSLAEGRDRAELDIDKLVPFSNHPFRLYEGDRMADMVESIRDNGVMVPIIVRRIADDRYEILVRNAFFKSRLRGFVSASGAPAARQLRSTDAPPQEPPDRIGCLCEIIKGSSAWTYYL
jgi:hypothetical protein